eukprot:g6089.t1
MAYVNKILIKGVRSFNPENDTPLTFYRPLTLIVGSNGAGKTTIIECLRMACTGTLPPSARSGHSFIHDPKVAKESEVKAQIRLQFHNPTDDVFVVIRSFQLIQKAASMQFKAIDQTLKRVDKMTNKSVAITHTCADMDKLVPSLMGISKAVLDNVIFVHQDEANWPLAEGKVLKEKFDLLFGTSRYSKEFDEIKKVRTAKNQELKLKVAELEHLKTRRNLATKLSSKIDKLETESSTLHDQISGYDVQIEDLSSQVRALEFKLQIILQNQGELNRLKSTLKTVRKHNEEMKEKLVDGDFDEDDDELLNHTKQCDVVIKRKEEELEKLQESLSTTQIDSLALQDQYVKLCQRQGKLQAEVENYQKCKSQRDAICERIKQFEMVKEYNDATDCLKQFERLVSCQEEELEKIKLQNRCEDRNLTEQLQSITVKIQLLHEKIKTTSVELNQTKTKLIDIQSKIEGTEDNDEKLNELQIEDEKLSRELEKFENFKTQGEATKVIENVSTEIISIDSKLQKLKEERNGFSFQNELVTDIKLKTKQLSDKKEQLDKIMEAHKTQIRAFLKQDFSPLDLIQKHEAMFNKIKDQHLISAESLKTVASSELLAMNELQSTKHELEKSHGAFHDADEVLKNNLYKILGKSVSVESYEYHLSLHEEKYKDCLEMTSLAGANAKLLQQYIDVAQESCICHVCARSFNSEEQQQNFIDKKRKELKSLPYDVCQVETTVNKIKREIEELKKLQPVWMEYKDLKDKKIPQLETQQTEIQSRVHALALEVKEARVKHESAERDLNTAQKLQQDVVWPASRLVKELESEEYALDQLQTQFDQHGTHGFSLNKIETEINELEKQRKVQEQERHQYQETSLLLMRTTEQQWNLQKKIAQLKSNTEQRQELLNEAFALTNKVLQKQDLLSTLETDSQDLALQKEALDNQLMQLRQTAVDQESLINHQLRDRYSLLREFQQKFHSVEQCEGEDPIGKLDLLKTQIQQLELKQEKLQKRVHEKQDKQNEEMEHIQQYTNLKRTIQDCLDWRKGKKEEQELLNKMLSTETTLNEQGSKESIERKLKTQQNLLGDHQTRRSHLDGCLSTLSKSLKEAKQDLDSDDYSGIEDKYKEALIEKVMLELMISDLMTLHKAFEKALLTYHTMKMEEVNLAMRELWRSIYRGSDIEYIQIKADEGSSASTRASYNYWLSMCTNGVDLEMRGRCSAGQKVLAGIVVRLALAEAFCAKCGILALDEPTTNLDEENVNSLADALRQLIETRAQEDYFQLIV